MMYHLQSALILMRNFSGRPVPYWPENSRNFVAVIPPEHVQPMKDAGWVLKFNETLGTWYVLVRIDPEYDQDLSALDGVPFNNAELFIEGRPWVHHGTDGVAVFLVSITPEQ